jgi:hypothetical protein
MTYSEPGNAFTFFVPIFLKDINPIIAQSNKYTGVPSAP